MNRAALSQVTVDRRERGEWSRAADHNSCRVARPLFRELSSIGSHHHPASQVQPEYPPPPTLPNSRREAGGITQEIRARTVSLQSSPGNTEKLGDSLEASASSSQATVATFLDTPGQEIFYRMRTNGARVADAVVLVVSGEVWVSGLGAWRLDVAAGVASH